MDPSDRSVDRLIGELSAEIGLIDELVEKNRLAKQRVDKAVSRFRGAHGAFLQFLEDLKGRLDG